MFFGSKEKEIETLILEHYKMVKSTVKELKVLVKDYLNNDKKFKDDSYKIHNLEHEADVIRRSIEVKLSQGAFLPVYREDYIVLIEFVDHIANKCETIADFIVLTRPTIPDFLKENVLSIIIAALEALEPFGKMYAAFSDNFKKVTRLSREVEKKEQEVDKIQWDAVKAVFKSEIPLAKKLHLKYFIDNLANLSNLIEDASDRFGIMVVKRAL